MIHLDIWNISYGQKKGQKSKCQFDSRSLKVENRPDLLLCKWCVTYYWKVLNESYNFSWDLNSIRGLHKLWASKVARVLILGISGPPTWGVPRQNDIWVQTLWPCTKNTIRGRWWLPPSSGRGESCESMFAHGLSMHQKCSNYALINLLFSFCKSVWIIDLLVTLPNPHPGAPTCPSTPKVLQAREHTPTAYPSIVFTLWTCSWVHQGVWGCVINLFITLTHPHTPWKTQM
jgi:hypothetical protein